MPRCAVPCCRMKYLFFGGLIELLVIRQGGGLRRYLDGSQSYYEFAGWLDTDAGHTAATGAFPCSSDLARKDKR
eukprot:5134106-Pyramimonas_sp.AAC.1